MPEAEQLGEKRCFQSDQRIGNGSSLGSRHRTPRITINWQARAQRSLLAALQAPRILLGCLNRRKTLLGLPAPTAAVRGLSTDRCDHEDRDR